MCSNSIKARDNEKNKGEKYTGIGRSVLFVFMGIRKHHKDCHVDRNN